MKKVSVLVVLLSVFALHTTNADVAVNDMSDMPEVMSSPESSMVAPSSSMDVQSRLGKLIELRKSSALSREKRALEDLICEVTECQEMVNIQNQFVSELRAFSLDLKQGVQSAQSIREFKTRNAPLVEELFGAKEAKLFKQVCELLIDQPHDVQTALVSASIKSLGYPCHVVKKDLSQKQKVAKLKAAKFPDMEMRVAF